MARNRLPCATQSSRNLSSPSAVTTKKRSRREERRPSSVATGNIFAFKHDNVFYLVDILASRQIQYPIDIFPIREIHCTHFACGVKHTTTHRKPAVAWSTNSKTIPRFASSSWYCCRRWGFFQGNSEGSARR